MAAEASTDAALLHPAVVPTKRYVTGAWHHVTIAVAQDPIDASRYREAISYDRKVIAEREAKNYLGGSLNVCDVNDLRIGIIDTAGTHSEAVVVYFDNLLVVSK